MRSRYKTPSPVMRQVVSAISLCLMYGHIPISAAQQSGNSPSAQATKPEEKADQIVVTGSRFVKRDFESNSPIITITGAQLAANQDVTLETFLNTLPQVNPHGTTTSNNPPNGGQANIDLRGLGSNRNLILIDGRRPMVSQSNQTVDLNTIPMSLVESIEIITGGAGAVYGADAIAGVVNVKLKRNFSGVDLRAGFSNSVEFNDARERNIGITIGGNLEGGRGNAVLSAEYSEREGMIKSQRSFAAVATATTSFFPEGTYRPSGTNLPSQAAIDALYGRAAYGGAAPGTVPRDSAHSFNSDGSLFYPGIFNRPQNVLNFRYPVDFSVNTNLFPDVYVYNFDAVNILVLPLERKSVLGKAFYKLPLDVEAFGQFAHTNYTSVSALAPTPVSTVTVAATGAALPTQASSSLLTPGRNVGTQLVVPTTNPFIPADLRLLLNSRTGDDPRILGSGADEAFLMRWRVLGTGLREARYDNKVTQYLSGLKGPVASTSWRWEALVSHGETEIVNAQSGNIDTNRLLAALAAPDGGASLCAGGVNPFGRQPLSVECQRYLEVSGALTTKFTQTIAQAFASGELAELPAGSLQAVVGAETRRFRYDFDPGAAAGPISGFTTQAVAAGSNSFRDAFGELSIPILRDAPFAKSLEAHVAARTSTSGSTDEVLALSSPEKRSNTWSLDLSWEPADGLRARASIQRSARAPNFGELFDGASSAPQIYDPCSVTSVARTRGANAAQLRTLCRDAGQAGGLGAAGVDLFVQTPGTQASVNFEGNPALDPETGISHTLGLVWEPKLSGFWQGLRGSIDYYRVKVKDAIKLVDTNEYIADCYNFYGNNPSYSVSYTPCANMFRSNDILGFDNLASPTLAYRSTNGGSIKTDGVDVQLNWGHRAGPGRLNLHLHLNYLLSFKTRTDPGLPENDFVGTVPYFGAGLGQAFPKLKATLSANYKWHDFVFDARARFIDKMKNRMSIIFPGEEFGGVPATTYWDVGTTWSPKKWFSIRAGVNNVLDQKPRTYTPNVQSGTDPSTYDVVGRRAFAQLNIKFN